MVRGDAAPRPRADERFATREARNANRAAMHALFQEFAATFSNFDDFEAALGAGAAGGGGDAAARRRRDGATWAQDREALVDVGDDGADRCACPRSPFRFSAASAGTTGGPRGRDSTTARCCAKCSA